MNELRVEFPPEVWAELVRRAGEGAESAWVAAAVRERLAADAELEYLAARAARGSREAFRRVMAKVPAHPPVPGDEWSRGPG